MIEPSDLVALGKHLRSYTYSVTTEAALHERLARVLTLGGFAHVHEKHLDKENRPDFLVQLAKGSIAVEVKMRASFSDVIEQVLRYAARSEVHGVLLVTTSSRLASSMPATLLEKPAHAVAVSTGLL